MQDPHHEIPRPPLPVEELERKHRILMERQRAVHFLQRHHADRALALKRAAEEALQLEEERLARARDAAAAEGSGGGGGSGAGSPSRSPAPAPAPAPAPSAALAELASSAAAAHAALRGEGGGLAALLLQQRLSQRHLLAHMQREMEKPCHKTVPLAGMSAASWDASQAAATPYPWPTQGGGGEGGEGGEEEEEEEGEEEEGEEEGAGASEAAKAPAPSPAAAAAAAASSSGSAEAAAPSAAAAAATSASSSSASAAPAAGGAAGGGGSRKRKKLTAEEREAKKLANWQLRYSGLSPCGRCGAHVPAKALVDCEGGCGRSLCARGGRSATEPLAGPCVSLARSSSGTYTCYDCAVGEELRGQVAEPYYLCAVGKACAARVGSEGARGEPAALAPSEWRARLAACPSCALRPVCRRCRPSHTKDCPGRGYKDVSKEEEEEAEAEEEEEEEEEAAAEEAEAAGEEEEAGGGGKRTGSTKKRPSRTSAAAAASAAEAGEEEEEAGAKQASSKKKARR